MQRGKIEVVLHNRVTYEVRSG